MRKLLVTKIEKLNIKHIYTSKVVKQNYIISFCLIAVIFSAGLFFNSAKNTDIIKTCVQIYNPINPLFNDDGNILFANANSSYLNNNSLKFITPIKCSNIKNCNSELWFEVDNNIMIVAPESGIISGVGVLPNGEKFIEISHNKNIKTRLENVYILGVVNGQMVSKGKDIGIAKLGETVRFFITENNVKQPNISINKNEIVWEKYQ